MARSPERCLPSIWPARRSRVGSSTNNSLYDYLYSPRAEYDELQEMLDGEGQRFEKREHEASLELSRLPSAATATASAVAAVAPVQAPAPAPSPIEIAVSSAQQEAVLKKLGVTAELLSRALRCTLRGLTKEDCAVLSHCATRGPLVAAMPSLQLLDLGFNSIDDEGCAPLPPGPLAGLKHNLWLAPPA